MLLLDRSLCRRLAHPVHALSLGLGLGAIRYAPGTWGSILALPSAYFLLELPMVWAHAVMLFAFLFSIWATGFTARALNVQDPSCIVLDEWVALTWLLLLLGVFSWGLWLTAFLLFRLFDIVKPWPIRDLDHSLHGGLGIMLDDIVAAVFVMLTFLLGALLAGFLLPSF